MSSSNLFDDKNRFLIEELRDTKFDSVDDVIQFLKDYDATFDKAKDDPVVNVRTKLILSAFVSKCSNPRENINSLTLLLGEEDINLPLLKTVENEIRKRESKEGKIKLPTLQMDIDKLSKSQTLSQGKAHATSDILTSETVRKKMGKT